MTYPINSIAGKKHQNLACHVREVAKIKPSISMMAPIDISSIAFIPGRKFIFRIFDFTIGVDGRLRVSNLEALQSG